MSVTAKDKMKRQRGEFKRWLRDKWPFFLKKKKAKCSHNKSETDIQKHTAVCSMSQRRYSGRCMLHKYTQRDV